MKVIIELSLEQLKKYLDESPAWHGTEASLSLNIFEFQSSHADPCTEEHEHGAPCQNVRKYGRPLAIKVLRIEP